MNIYNINIYIQILTHFGNFAVDFLGTNLTAGKGWPCKLQIFLLTPVKLMQRAPQDSQGWILALAFKLRSLKPFKEFPHCSEAAHTVQ